MFVATTRQLTLPATHTNTHSVTVHC